MLLAHAALAVTATAQCSPAGQNCWQSMCCQDPKAQCHAKKEGYALCLSNCTKGIHPGEPKNDSYWECNVLAKCAWGAASGENCMIKGCCQEPNKTCFTKVGGYGQCRNLCPKGWNCTKVANARPYLALPCNKEFEQCGGQHFKKNPCCQDGLVCYGDQPEYYMQCTNKAAATKKDNGKANGKAKAETDDDDDDAVDVRLSALPTSLHKKQEPHAKLPGFSILGIGLMLAIGGAALAARKKVWQGVASHQFLCTEDGVQEEPLQPTSFEG